MSNTTKDNKVTNEETFNSTDAPETYTDDANNKDRKQIDKRNETYTKILERYQNHIENVLDFKEKKRKTIYVCSLILLIVPIFGLIYILYMISLKNLTDIKNLVAFITAISAVISAILIIPNKVGEYLFNDNDTQQIIEIVKNIQEYDNNVRTDIRERNKK